MNVLVKKTNKTTMKQFLLPLFFLILLTACEIDTGTVQFPDGEVEGYYPVYEDQETSRIEVLPARGLSSPGKIYVHNQYLFVVDQGEGVHVINNNNPDEPQPVSYIAVPGAGDIAVKGTALYVSQIDDLVVINITNPENPEVVRKLEDVFYYDVNAYPPQNGVYYICPDPDKKVIKWVKGTIEDPKCYLR